MTHLSYTDLVEREYNRNPTVNERASGNQIKNYSGAYVFDVGDEKRLERFLILGSSTNTYYANAKDLTKSNMDNIKNMVDKDAIGVLNKVLEISISGRAPKNNPALLVLAYVGAKAKQEFSRTMAYNLLPEVARTASDLFAFMEYSSLFRGHGKALRRGIANWYNSKDVDRMAYQMVKYQQRTHTPGSRGWSHADLIRVSHVKAVDEAHNKAFRWSLGLNVAYDELPRIMQVYEAVKSANTEAQIISLIERESLTHEFVPRRWHGNPKVWRAMIGNLPLKALVTNLGRLTHHDLLNDFSSVQGIKNRLLNPVAVQKSRIHPVDVLNALAVYRTGGKERTGYGKLTWSPLASINGILEDMFYLSFANVEPANKRIMIALDVSASMTWSNINNMQLTPRSASAAMAMSMLKVEPNVMITGFSAAAGNSLQGIERLNISKNDGVFNVIKYIDTLHATYTDCSLPMNYAKAQRLEIDAFVIYTDNETNSGSHPYKALEQYRQQSGINAALIVNAMTSSGFTIANPNDPKSLDIVGFDSAAPQITREFILM